MKIKNIKIIVVITLLAFAGNFVYAQNLSRPQGTPSSSNNVAAPINTGTSSQTKDGSLHLRGENSALYTDLGFSTIGSLDVGGSAQVSGTLNASHLTTDTDDLNLSGGSWGMNFFIDTNKDSNDYYRWYSDGINIASLHGNTGNFGTTGIISATGSIRSALSLYATNPANDKASVGLNWLDNVARIRVGGSGAGSSNGLDIQTVGNKSLMRLLSNGRVGIGTTSPIANLDVAGPTIAVGNTPGAGNGQGRFFISESGTNYGLSLVFNGNETDSVYSVPGGNNWGLVRHNNNSTGVTIFGGSRANNDVSFNGKVSSSEYCIGTSCITAWPTSQEVSTPSLQAVTDVGSTTINNIGIGTEPEGSYRLTIQQSSNGSGEGLRLINGNGNRSLQAWVGTGGAVLDAEGETNLHIRTGGTDRLFVRNTNGNIGIGTTSPIAKLDVAGPTVAVGNTPGGSNGQGRFFISESGNNYGLSLVFNGDENDSVYSVPGGNNWGLVRHNNNSTGVTIFGGSRTNNNVSFNGKVSSSEYCIGTSCITSWSQAGTTASTSSLQAVTDVGNLTTKAISANAFSAPNWFRSTDDTGWYNETHDGGLYMEDSTWVRTYKNKGLWAGTGHIGTNGSLTIGHGGTFGPNNGAIIKGNVSIGSITSPNMKLHISDSLNGEIGLRLRNTNSGTGASAMIRLNNNQGGEGASHGIIFLNSSTRTSDGGQNAMTMRNNLGDLRLHSKGSNGIVIESDSGDVGIGANTPGAKLDVAGNIRTSSYYNFNGNPVNPTTAIASIYDQSGVGPTISGNSISFRILDSSMREEMRINSSGITASSLAGTGSEFVCANGSGLLSRCGSIVVLEGTTPANANSTVHIQLPTGWNYSNTVVLSVAGNNSTSVVNWKNLIGASGTTYFDCDYTLSDYRVIVGACNSGWRNIPIRITVMKFK